jgi:hypothetical protein
MNRKLTTLATMFAAGAIVATSSSPRATAASPKSNSDKALLEVGCGADKKDGKDATCGGEKKKDGEAKGMKEHKCGKDMDGKCGKDMKDGKHAKGKKGAKTAKAATETKGDKDKKDASCGKGSCGSKN